jgi:hypothetical protein
MEAERNGDEKGKEAVDNDFRKIEEERYKRKEELLSQKDKQEIVDILARELVSVENKINQEIKQRQREEAMHIEDTQRLVTEIEMLKVVLYLVSRKSR